LIELVRLNLEGFGDKPSCARKAAAEPYPTVNEQNTLDVVMMPGGIDEKWVEHVPN
jgi:hypothetical protein